MNTCSQCEWWKPNPGTCEESGHYCPAATTACQWFVDALDDGPLPDEMEAPRPATVPGWCDTCGGEGQMYTSRYGGNDPDVWPTGVCPECRGTGRDPGADQARECAA